MTKLKEKVQSGLDEVRMLVLGIQVFIGFGFRAVLEPGFDRLSHALQLVKLASLSLLLLAFGLTLAPAADHRICERGEDSAPFQRLVTTFAALALLPFATALALDFAVVTDAVAGAHAGVAAAVVVAVVALGLWYGIELLARRRKDVESMPTQGEREKTELKDKIRHVLTESRVVLPGAQALLGFQLASTLVDGFAKLPGSLKLLHLASLSAVALSTILLITPAAWHRLVERGENSERFHRFASAMVLCALVPLALGMAGDFYLVVAKITESSTAAAAAAAALLVVFFVLWFGIGLARRARGRGAPHGDAVVA